MLEYLMNETNKTFTQNGAVTNISTKSYCLDLFSVAGALRNATEAEIINRFIKAYTENSDLAMKILFFLRDIREGLGERRTFRIILKWLCLNHPQSVIKNALYINEYGRFDDLLSLLNTDCEDALIDLIKSQLESDIKAYNEGSGISLLAKWLPSINASNPNTVKVAKYIATKLNMTNVEYRKLLSKLRYHIGIIENNLRTKDYAFNYESVPSIAMFKYRKAFLQNDEKRYSDYLSKVSEGKAKMHTETLTPYDIVNNVLKSIDWHGKSKLSEKERDVINTTWNALPGITSNDNTLAIIDTSASMHGYCGLVKPAAVAMALGIYFAEYNTGTFSNHFMTFSEKPRMIEIKGETLVDKVSYIASFNGVANTDLEAAFKLILNTALKYNVPQSELPSRLVIISDMEFDYCTENASLTNFENAKKMFEDNGYKLPEIVFWNVNSLSEQQPVTINDTGVALVSGASPKIFDMVTSGELNPYALMIEIVESERYKDIVA